MAILGVREITAWTERVQLRAADEAECALGGMTGEFAVKVSVENSLCAWVAEHDGDPLVFWGYAPQSLLGDVCQAWMLTTPLADEFPVFLGLKSRKVIAHIQALYPHILITVDPAHILAIAWLNWLGFTVDGPIGPFIQMRKSRWAH